MSNREATDRWLHGICQAVAANSKCLSRQIGALIVMDKTILISGYNGPPRGIPHCSGEKCPRQVKGFSSGQGLHLCPAAHAERNALIQAARHGVTVNGATVYLNSNVPCAECLKEIINAGIIEVVCQPGGLYDHMSGWLLDNSNLRVRIFDHLLRADSDNDGEPD
jgi:dCMP deaminase